MVREVEEYCKVTAELFPTQYNGSYGGFISKTMHGLGEENKKAVVRRWKGKFRKSEVIPDPKSWELCFDEVKEVYRVVNNACRFFRDSGGNTAYLDTVVYELCAYQVKNVIEVCDNLKRSYGQQQSKALPSIPDWRDAVRSVKSSKSHGYTRREDVPDPISDEEKEEVDEMLQDLYTKIGAPENESKEFRNKASLMRHGGIYEYLGKGFVQVYTPTGAEWVKPEEVNGRVEIDHSKTVELVHTGRIDMKKYRKMIEK
jgi:hypothetical protein